MRHPSCLMWKVTEGGGPIEFGGNHMRVPAREVIGELETRSIATASIEGAKSRRDWIGMAAEGM